MANLGDISKINLPNGNVVNIKDATAQTNIAFVANQGRKNVLKFDSVGGGVYSGITYTVNNDGTVRATGTANATSYLYLMINNAAVDAKEYTNGQFILSGCPSGGGSNTYSLYAAKGSYAKFDYGDGVTLTPTSETQVFVVLRVEKNQTVNIVFKPMIRLVGTDSTFEPYSMSNAVITPELIELVDSGAKNLYNPSNTSTSASGLTGTITRNSDGSYTINGTTSSTVYYNMGSWITPEDGYYILSGGSAAETAYQLIYDDHNWQTYESGEKKKLAYWTKGSTHNLYIRLGTGITLSNVTFKPMICSKAAWDVSQKYVPYSMSNAELTAKKQDKPSVKYSNATIGTTYENPTGMFWTVPAKSIVRLTASIHGDGTNYPGGIFITFSTSAAYANPENVLAKYEPTGNELNLAISTIYPRPADTSYTLWLYVKGKASAEYRITYTMDILDTFD